MANADTLIAKLDDIGDAIRAKTGGTEKLTLDEMPDEIARIAGGGNTLFKELVSGEITSVSSGDLPSTLRPYAFYQADKLEDIDLSGINEVPNYCFYGCSSLSDVGQTFAPVQIGSLAFCDCVSLTHVDLSQCKSIGTSGFNRSGLSGEISLPSGCSVESSAFARTAISSFSLPGQSSVGGQALDGCSDMTSCSIPDLQVIGNRFFADCTSLREVNLPSVTGMQGNFPFSNCTSLETISLPALVSNTAYYAFSNCTALKTVDLPLLKTAAQNMFEKCTALQSIALPALLYLPNDIFSGCSSLARVELPSCTSINGAAFRGTTESLTTVVLAGDTVATVSGNWATPFNQAINFYVPDSLVSTYKSASGWWILRNEIFPISELPK